MTQGSLADSNSGEFKPWDPLAALTEPHENDVRYGAGFMRAQPEQLFKTIGEHWLPMFHVLGAEVSILSVGTGFGFPEGLDRITPLEVDGEPAVIGLDVLSERAIIDTCSAGAGDTAADVVLEYLERRLIATLSQCWSRSSSLECSYVPPESTTAVEVVAAVHINLRLAGNDVNVCVGIGPRALERLDLEWKDFVAKQSDTAAGNLNDELHRIDIELAELSVPPAMLIDYMRSGAFIDLGVPLTTEVSLRLNSSPWGKGELCRVNGRLAARITAIGEELFEDSENDNTTRVGIEIANVALDRQGVLEHGQVGAYLLTNSPAVNNTALMRISGEDVASAIIGQIADSFALNVLPK